MTTKLKPLFSCALAAGLFFSASSANATLYTFIQTGFDEGATITGSFVANDLDNSGQIDSATTTTPREVTAFSLAFSGNSIVGAFTQNLTDLSRLVYNVGSAFLGDQIFPSQEGVGTDFAQVTGFDYYSGMRYGGFGGAVTDQATGQISYSDELVSVSVVPSPAVSWLLGSALPGFIAFSRRKQVLPG